MDNLKIHCMCLDNHYLSAVKKLDYIPVGLKNKNFSGDWLLDSTLVNISKKNPYYGEYTFYYWYWKNKLINKNKEDWVGFCSYRELWGNQSKISDKTSFKSILQNLPSEWSSYNSVIGESFVLKKPGLGKMFKYGKIASIRNYKELFNSQFSIKFQFDMFHGNGILDKAIKLLPTKDINDFNFYVKNETSINQGNMFISNSSTVIDSYFSEVFEWLEKCEKFFGFNLIGHRKIRMYTFLAERFLPFWFKKYTKYIEWPVVYCDINTNADK